MSKKPSNTLYALGYEENGRFYIHDYYTGTYNSVAAAQKACDGDDDSNLVIFRITPVSVSKARKREWQDVESR